MKGSNSNSKQLKHWKDSIQVEIEQSNEQPSVDSPKREQIPTGKIQPKIRGNHPFEKKMLTSLTQQQDISIISQRSNSKKDKPKWKSSCHYKFIQFWQTIFNRRIVSFSCFALQFGDIIFFSLITAILVYTCVYVNFSKASGQMAELTMTLTVIFGCRNGAISYLFGLSLERAVMWHQFLAWITLGLSIYHWFTSFWIISGYIIQAAMVGFIVFSIKPFRRNMWEFFMKMHWLLIVLLFIGSLLHGVGLVFISCIYYLLDVLYRLYTVYKHRHISKSIKLERVGMNITKLSLKSIGSSYKGGQYFFVMIPKISYFEWHPFSVFSASYEEDIVIYIKSLGDWTSQLYLLAGEKGKPTEVKGYLDGPYGSHSISIEGDKYKNFMCISGGIGLTPIISTAKEIFYEMEFGRPVKNLIFIWTGRDSAIIENVFEPNELKELLSQEDSKILKTFYHYSLQGDKKIIDIEQACQKEEKEFVKLTPGRPNFSKYFEQAHKQALQSGHSLVGVLTCGPQDLIDIVESEASRWSKNGIRFDVHQEVFNF